MTHHLRIFLRFLRFLCSRVFLLYVAQHPVCPWLRTPTPASHRPVWSLAVHGSLLADTEERGTFGALLVHQFPSFPSADPRNSLVPCQLLTDCKEIIKCFISRVNGKCVGMVRKPALELLTPCPRLCSSTGAGACAVTTKQEQGKFQKKYVHTYIEIYNNSLLQFLFLSFLK